jgi:hypothetical protein
MPSGGTFCGLAADALEQVTLLDPLLHRHADVIRWESSLLEVANRRLCRCSTGEEPTTVRPVISSGRVSRTSLTGLMTVLLNVVREAVEPTYDADSALGVMTLTGHW